MRVEAKGLTHIYEEGMPEESVAVDNVSFNIEGGEFCAIIGHTGSGKSTLLQLLDGLLVPKEGQIFIGDVDITEKGISKIDVRRKIGLVFQYPEYQLFEEDVKTDVAFGPKNLGLDEEEIYERVREAIGLVGLDYEKIKNASPFDLSGGQKRRVAIAGVIAMKPEVLILDEPTAGLDPKAHDDILKMIRKIHGNVSDITILVSHNMNDVALLADKILVMDNGRIVMNGSPSEVFARADELEEMGLDLPDATKLARDLAERGVKIEGPVFTIDEAHMALRKVLKEHD